MKLPCRMILRLACGCVASVTLAAAFCPGRSAAEAVTPAAADPTTGDDQPELLVPKQPRTEADRDHLEAVALFATGRMHERREEYAAALRCYQRALRCDSQSSTVVRAIILLDRQLQRDAEAVRYLLKAGELADADPSLLQSLGRYSDARGRLGPRDHAL